MSRYFPLVPRPRPACRPLPVRIGQVADLSRRAGGQHDDSLIRAAEAHNFAALILSDTGLSHDAYDLCRRQFTLFAAAGRTLDAAEVKLAAQPLVNIARLRIRDGDGDHAHHILTALFEAIKTRTPAVVADIPVDFGGLIRDDDHRLLTQWMWTVMLADGTRALTRAGRWADAYRHVVDHHGIGDRLLEGRQVAILAHSACGDHDTAEQLLDDTAASEPWEHAVTACLRVACRLRSGRPVDTAISAMHDTYTASINANDNTGFHVRLGLAAMSLARGHREITDLATLVEQAVASSGDAYTAHEAILARPAIPWSPAAQQAMSVTVRDAGLAAATLAAELLDALLRSVTTSELAIAGALAAEQIVPQDVGQPAHGVPERQAAALVRQNCRLVTVPDKNITEDSHAR